MGEHTEGWQKTLKTKTGQDVYFWNFVLLMVFTVIEVGAVYIDFSLVMTQFILIAVGVIKFFGIAAFFMHLWDDEYILRRTFAFPFIFVLIALYGIGLSVPGGVDTLPSWCSPPWVPSYDSGWASG